MRGGIDLGGTKIQAVVIDESDSVAGQARRSTPRDGGPADVADAIAEALEEAAKAAGGTPAALTGIGVGSPGTVNEATGTVANARNLRNWTNPFPLGETLASRFGVPVRVGNDVGTAVEGEAVLGAGRPFRTFLGLWWGTGVGGAIMVERHRWLGRGAAGEIGHMVIKLGGARCTCGRRGCVEAYAGRAALERAATDTWQQLYIEFTDWAQAEHVFTEHILPVLLQLQNTGQIRSWWFLRKHPCWRLR